MPFLDAAGQFNPNDWYWKARNGSVYARKRNSLVYSYDSAYLAFVAKTGGATPWPVDTTGKQTASALQEVLSAYGINVTVPGP
jgi:hypothetical protein